MDKHVNRNENTQNLEKLSKKLNYTEIKSAKMEKINPQTLTTQYLTKLVEALSDDHILYQQNAKRSGVAAKMFCIKDLFVLHHNRWLNDNICEYYCALLNKRNRQRCRVNAEFVSAVILHARWWALLYNKVGKSIRNEQKSTDSMEFLPNKKNMPNHREKTEYEKSNPEYNYSSVARWSLPTKLESKYSRGIDTIFELDSLGIIVHWKNLDSQKLIELGWHLAFGHVSFRRRKLQYFDSLPSTTRSATFFKLIRFFLEDEFEDKEPKDYDLKIGQWTNETMTGFVQPNRHSCGILALTFADWISDGLTPDFQVDMAQKDKAEEICARFRHNIKIECLRGMLNS